MSVVYFLILVGVLVTIHELGHFLAAKALDVKVLRFSLGFGPALASVRGRETEYRVGVVPLGGYVRLYGEDPGDAVADADRHRAFLDKPLWKRLVVVFAGPVANLLLPFVIYFFFFLGHTELPAAVVGGVLAGSPAAEAQLEPGDRVLAVDGTTVRYWEELERVVDASAGRSVKLTIQRNGQELKTYVEPRRDVVRHRDGQRSEQGLIGVIHAPFPPQIGVLDPASPAGRAGLRTGDLIVSVDGEPVDGWRALERALERRPRRVALAYLRAERASVGFATVKRYRAAVADLVPDFAVGPDQRRTVETGLRSAEFFVAAVEPSSPAARAGLRPGDLIDRLDGQRVTHWRTFDQALMAEPDREWRIGWQRASATGTGVEPHEATIRQERRRVGDEFGHPREVLVFGATNDFRPGRGEMAPIEGRVTYAATHAWSHTGTTIAEMVRGFAALLGGDVAKGAVGGPIMVYRIASVSGHKGWDSFLLMIALVSINLGLINLLPIPILDGGHLVMFAIEALRRRRLSPRVRDAFLFAGLAVIVSLTVLALRNDIVRYMLNPP